MFKNCFQEIALRQLKENQYEEALESFALSKQTKINILLETEQKPKNFELHWMLLGFSDSFISVLIKNKLIKKALQTLILLGDADQAMKILNSIKNPTEKFRDELAVSYTHLTLPTTPYV